jgi:hypothetical protein
MKKVSLIVALCFLLFPIVGLADTIDFTGSASGSIGISGNTVGSSTISVSDLTIGFVQGVGVPNNQTGAPGLTVTGGTVSFTGTLTNVSVNGGVAEYVFTLTSLTITGGVSAAGVANGTTLMNLTGTGTTVVITTGTSGWSVNLEGAPVSLSAVLLAYFGAPTTGWAIDSSINTNAGPACATTNTCTDGFTLTAESQSQFTALEGVPEPGTLSMLGLGMLGVLGLGVRRFA